MPWHNCVAGVLGQHDVLARKRRANAAVEMCFVCAKAKRQQLQHDVAVATLTVQKTVKRS